MARHNILEAPSFEVQVYGDQTEDAIGSIILKVEKVPLELMVCHSRCVKTSFL